MGREKKRIKKSFTYEHDICIITVAILHMNSVIDGLMCVVFEQNCVKLNTFSILHLLMQVHWKQLRRYKNNSKYQILTLIKQ